MRDLDDATGLADVAAEFFAALVDVGLVIDADDRIVAAAPSVRRILGWPVERLIGTDYLSLVHPEDRPAASAAVAGARAGQPVERHLRRIRCADGGWRRLEISYERGAVGRLHFVCRDRTDALRLAERMVEAEAVSGVGAWDYDLDTGALSLSPIAETVFGEAAGRGIDALLTGFTAESRDVMAGALRRLVHQGRSFDVVLPMVAPDGGARWARVTGRPEVHDGLVSRVYGVFQDQTESRREAQRLAEVIRGSGAGAWEWHVPSGESRHDERWTSMLGYTPDELLPITPEKFTSLIHPEDHPAHRAALEAHLSGETPDYSIEMRMRRKDGGWTWVLSLGRVTSWTADGWPEWMVGTHIDVTARRAQGHALETAQRRMAATLSAIPDLLIELDAGGRYVDVHAGVRDLLACDPRTLIGKLLEDVVPPEVATLVRSAMAEVDRRGRCEAVEYSLPLPAGARWFELTASAAAPACDGARPGYLLLIRNVTRRVEAQEAATYRARLLQALFDMSPLGIVLADRARGEFLDANDAYLRMKGLSREALVGRKIATQAPPESAALDAEMDRIVEATGRAGPYERVTRRADGSALHTRMHRVRVPASDGGSAEWALIEDISQQKRLEGELAAEREFLRFLIETNAAAILAFDADSVVLFANREAERMINRPASEIVGRHTLEVGYRMVGADGAPLPPEAMPSFRVRATGQPVRDERAILEYWDGRRLYVKVAAYPIHAPGSRARIVLSCLDITEEVQREQALARENDALEARVRERTEQLERALAAQTEIVALQRRVISVVSHEFRTPLAIIDAGARKVGRLIERGAAAEAGDPLRKIRQSVVRLTGLVEGVLDAARLQEGRIELRPEPMSLADLVHEAVEMQREIAERMTFRLDLAGLGEIVADRRLVYQIVANMLSNAVKYSGDATVVEVRATEDADGVRLAVRDHGVGVPVAELPNIFRSFFRASTSMGVEGAGLGLNLSRTLAEMHGGDLAFDSVEGVGSTVTLTLPRVARPVIPAG
jgi:PAS domain S-box-containing protein